MNIVKSIATALVALFSTSQAQAQPQPALSADQQALLAKAESTVRNYISAGKQFPLFAMAMEADSQVMSYLPTTEFASDKEALAGILKELIPKARDGQIRANVLVTPMAAEPGTNTAWAVFDLEQRGAPRVVIMLPYQGMGAGASYGPKTFGSPPPKLFAAP